MNRRETIKSIGFGAMSALLPFSHLLARSAFAEKSGYFLSQKNNVLQFLETTQYSVEGWGRWKYNILMERKYGLESSAMGIQILDMLGTLETVPKAKKKQALQFFNLPGTQKSYIILIR